MSTENLWERLASWSQRSVLLKLATAGFIVLLLLIPSFMIQDLIREREAQRDHALRDISALWGGAQTLSGPILRIPFEYFESYVDDKGTTRTRKVRDHLLLLPKTLHITGQLTPEIRHRGIYNAVLYTGQVELSGEFASLPATEAVLRTATLLHHESTVLLGISDVRGIAQAVTLTVDSSYAFEPGVVRNALVGSGIQARCAANLLGRRFKISLALRGSERLGCLPTGQHTTVQLQAPWASPSFEGAFAAKHNITDTGFEASWTVLSLNRDIPAYTLTDFPTQAAENYSFGVRLYQSVDEYQKAHRAVRYSAMIIFLLFLVFVFLEIRLALRIHPIQYMMVGFGILVFYVLLVAMGEFMSFAWAYLLGSVASVGLLTWYTQYIVHHRQKALTLGLFMAGLLGYFYTLVQLEEYALLVGAIGLFVILAGVLYFSRSINWYDSGTAAEQ